MPSTSPFHVMTKPVGASCNLNCTYCYYLHKSELLPHSNLVGKGRIGDALLETFIQQYINAQPCADVHFAWQGGEPTLAGIAFFERVVELQNQYKATHHRIHNAIQTNGTMIDDNWAQFLKNHDFLVGLSIDGPKHLHDQYRKDQHGNGTHDEVLAVHHRLLRYGVPHNAMVCINATNQDAPLEVYRHLKKEGFDWIQFIPVVEPGTFTQLSPSNSGTSEHPQRFVTKWSVSPEKYGDFLISVFDEWIREDVGKRFVQIFDECLSVLCGAGHHMCVFQPVCGHGLALQPDGAVYSCDHYVYPDHMIGNIRDGRLIDMVQGQQQIQFGHAKLDSLPSTCRRCDVASMCNGGCPKDRFALSPDGEHGLNYLCAGYHRFFTHIAPQMNAMAWLLRRGHPASDIHKLNVAPTPSSTPLIKQNAQMDQSAQHARPRKSHALRRCQRRAQRDGS